MFGRLLGWYTIYTFLRFSHNGISPGAKFPLRPSLAFSYIAVANTALAMRALRAL